MEKELDELIADRIVEVMNSALESDPAAVYALTEARVPCNKALAEHPTIQVAADGGKFGVGLLGVLNGLAGTQEHNGVPGWGRVEAVFQVFCPEHGKHDGLVVGDPCPVCGQSLVLGPLDCFRRVGSHDQTGRH